jgi:broad specificity phosphatase PhoE
MVRHALSVWNVQGRWQGQADPPLSAEGERQAREAAARIGPVGLVVSSDLTRARRTAELLAPEVPVVTEPLLREFDVGAWSGLTRAEIGEEWGAELDRFDAGRLEAPPGGEPRSRFETRVVRAAERIAERVAETATARTLVVTHGGVLRTLARLLTGVEAPVRHLCGYEAEVKGNSLLLLAPVDLLATRAGTPGPGEQMDL